MFLPQQRLRVALFPADRRRTRIRHPTRHEHAVHLELHRSPVRGLFVWYTPLRRLAEDVLRDVDLEVEVVYSDAFGFCLPAGVATVVDTAHGAGLVFLVVSLDVQKELGWDV